MRIHRHARNTAASCADGLAHELPSRTQDMLFEWDADCGIAPGGLIRNILDVDDCRVWNQKDLTRSNVDPAVRITHALAALQRQLEEGRVNVHSAQSMRISCANPDAR